jgi:hypothetical protein
MEEICFRARNRFNWLNSIYLYQILQSQFCYLFGNYEKAHEFAIAAEKLFDSIPGSVMLAQHLFYKSLIIIARVPTASKEDQKTYLKQLRNNKEQLKIWAVSCPENFSNMHRLVEAEMARINGNDMQAMQLYDQAIEAAGEQGFIQNQAVANELCAHFWLEKGKEDFSDVYLKKAHYGFKKWEAKCKVKNLEVTYPRLESLLETVPSDADGWPTS